MHLLGLGVDAADAALCGLMNELREARDARNPKIIAKLQSLGVRVGMDDVLAAAADRPSGAARVVGRVHIAEALRRSGAVRTLKEAFDRYLGDDAPAYVDKERLNPAAAIRAIRKSGGLAVLAHPVQLHCDDKQDLERIVSRLMDDGLQAIEIYHPDHTNEQTRAYLDLAIRLNLGVTGGSDFHGEGKPDVRLGIPHVPLAAIRECDMRIMFGGM
jgi:hypothetical protein